jgi:hypothetical protein
VSTDAEFDFVIGHGLDYRVKVVPDRYRGGYAAKLIAGGLGVVMEPGGKTAEDALTQLAKELRAGDATDRKIAKEIVRLAWFPLKLS